jgi:hypothetical protein
MNSIKNWIFGAIGLGLTCAGILLSYPKYPKSASTRDDWNGMAGVVLVTAGVALLDALGRKAWSANAGKPQLISTAEESAKNKTRK